MDLQSAAEINLESEFNLLTLLRLGTLKNLLQYFSEKITFYKFMTVNTMHYLYTEYGQVALEIRQLRIK